MELAASRIPWRSAVGALILAVACAGPTQPVPTPRPVEAPRRNEHLLVLLLDEPGRVGSITVSNAAGAQLLTQPGQAVRVSGPGMAPSAPFVPVAAEVTRMFAEALAVQPPPPTYFVLRFRDDSDQLTPESEALLDDVVLKIAERRSADVSIVGHTDTVGTRDYNYRLGLRRAERVRAALQARGVASSPDRSRVSSWSPLSVESHGENALLVPTPDDVAEPRNRRVEIIVR